MKKLLIPFLLTAITIIVPLKASAVTYNANITAIFGGGNPNGGWVENTVNNTQLGLRAKHRTTGSTANTLGVYQFAAADALFASFEFSVNSDANGLTGRKLSDIPLISYDISVDVDSSAGINYNTYSLFLYPDNSLGNNSTANGAGVETGQYNLYSIMQNSERFSFFPNFVTTPGTYDLLLTAKSGGTILNSVHAQAQIGDRAPASVPDGGSTFALLGLGIAGMGGIARFKKNKSVK